MKSRYVISFIWLNKLNILFMHINFIYFQGDIVLYLVSIISRRSYRARWSFTFTLALEKPVSCTISWLLCSSKWNKVSTIASMDSSSLRPWRMLSKRSCVGVVPKHWVRRRMASGCLQNWLLRSCAWFWVWYNTNWWWFGRSTNWVCFVLWIRRFFRTLSRTHLVPILQPAWCLCTFAGRENTPCFCADSPKRQMRDCCPLGLSLWVLVRSRHQIYWIINTHFSALLPQFLLINHNFLLDYQDTWLVIFHRLNHSPTILLSLNLL